METIVTMVRIDTVENAENAEDIEDLVDDRVISSAWTANVDVVQDLAVTETATEENTRRSLQRKRKQVSGDPCDCAAAVTARQFYASYRQMCDKHYGRRCL